MHQIERYLERLLDLSSANITITAAVLFVGGIGLLWVVCNGWGR
jgi:hypothetical protein